MTDNLQALLTKAKASKDESMVFLAREVEKELERKKYDETLKGIWHLFDENDLDDLLNASKKGYVALALEMECVLRNYLYYDDIIRKDIRNLFENEINNRELLLDYLQLCIVTEQNNIRKYNNGN